MTRQSLFKTCHYRPFVLLYIHFLTWLTVFLHPGGPVELRKTTSHRMFVEKIIIDDLQRSIFERRESLVQLTLILNRVFWWIREFLVESCTAVIVFAEIFVGYIFLADLEGHCKETFLYWSTIDTFTQTGPQNFLSSTANTNRRKRAGHTRAERWARTFSSNI